MVIDIASLPTWQRALAAATTALFVVALAGLITRCLRAIAPANQSKSIDRSAMRVQKRVFLGRLPLGPYRTPLVQAFVTLNIVAVWIIVGAIIIALAVAVF